MKKNSQFEKIINEKIKLGKPKIGFGLKEENNDIIKGLINSKKYAEITLVGPSLIKNIKGFDKIISNNPEKELANMLFNNKLEGIVRGTIDDLKTFEAYQDLIGIKKARKMFGLSLIEDFYKRQFFLSQASNPFGWSKKEKIKDCEGIIGFMKDTLNIEPKIGLITGIRDKTYKRKKNSKDKVQKILNKTFEDAEFITVHFRKQKIKVKNYNIEIETALKEGCNIIVPPNGMVGNQIFRSLVLIGGGKLLTGSRVNLPHLYEDNSRSETNFESHIKWLVFWINSLKYKNTEK